MTSASDDESAILIAENEREQFLYETGGLRYVPDALRHVYGKSTRPPLESWLLRELAFVRDRYPGYEIFTLGSSCVFGERFITYITVTEFQINGQRAFENLKRAVHASDMAIRRKPSPFWKWDAGLVRGDDIAFVVGHMDFAYFLQHRKEFLGPEHKDYMRSFSDEHTRFESYDFKVLHDGSIVPFDAALLDDEDRQIYENFDRIRYWRQPRGAPSQ